MDFGVIIPGSYFTDSNTNSGKSFKITLIQHY